LLGDNASAKDLGSVEAILAASPNSEELLQRAEQDPNWNSVKIESVSDQNWFRSLMEILQ
jgi:hypothetical protein